MPAKSRFTRLDAFTKTVEDARVRTTSGGVVTVVSLVLILYLVWGEWVDYRRLTVHPELIVDKGRGEKMEIYRLDENKEFELLISGPALKKAEFEDRLLYADFSNRDYKEILKLNSKGLYLHQYQDEEGDYVLISVLEYFSKENGWEKEDWNNIDQIQIYDLLLIYW